MPDEIGALAGALDDSAIDATTRGGRIWRLGVKLGVGGLLVAGMVGGISFLHLRAELSPAPDPVPPLPVGVARMAQQESYTLEQRFAGRLEPRRSTTLAFERDGLLTRVLVEEGDSVAAGQVVARLDTAVLEARRQELEAERQALTARLELARITARRQRQLANQGNASKQRYDEARLEAAAVEAELAALQAGIAQLDIEIGKSSLTAPYAGRIASRESDEGSILAAGAPVALLMESAAPEARIGLSPEAAAGLALGERYLLEIAGRVRSGRLLALRPDLAGGTRTVSALFRIEDEGSETFLGELAVLRLERQVRQPGYWLPLSALVSAPKGLWQVYTLEADATGGHRVAAEAVVVHHVRGETAYVGGSLHPGSLAVVEGPHRVVPGQAATPLVRKAPLPQPETAEPAALVVYRAPAAAPPPAVEH